MMPDALVYDRTQTDVTNRTAKGFWNVSDLTRIKAWLDYLKAFTGRVYTVKSYSLGDEIILTDLETLLSQITTARIGRTWSWTPEVPTSAAWNYEKANDIEKILYDANLWEVNRAAGTIYSGMINCGQLILL